MLGRQFAPGLALLVAGCFNPTISNNGFLCNASDAQPCPSGFRCVAGRCTNTSGVMMPTMAPLSIAKTGAPRTGQELDPMLHSTADCPDEALEPNDGPGAAPFGPAIALSVSPGVPSPRVTNMAICPTGPNPATGAHDVDWFTLTLAAPATLVAEAYYDVMYGDLDLAIVDGTGAIVASDGSAVSNACASASLPAGGYYVVVVGAGGSDVNRYQLRVSAFSGGASCGGGVDLGSSD